MAAVPGTSGTYQGGNGQSSKRLQQTQAQVNEVVDIMRVNVEKVLERDQKLSELDDRAGALQAGAQQFESTATRLKRKYWWKNLKMWLIIIGIGLVLLIIIIVSIVGGSKSGGDTPTPSSVAPATTQSLPPSAAAGPGQK